MNRIKKEVWEKYMLRFRWRRKSQYIDTNTLILSLINMTQTWKHKAGNAN
jgi:hypothetical protein